MIRSRPPVVRDRYIDLLRVLGVTVVVLGHWAVFVVFWEGDTIRGINALSVIPAIRPVTWIVQVMPLMFFLGGFANARSLDRREGSVTSFLRDRLIRLLWPTGVFVGAWLVLGLVQAAAGLAEPDLLRRAADVAALPFWFLGIYLVAVGLAPATLRLHRRFRWWVPGLLALGALAVDIVSRYQGLGDLGALNYAFVWLLAHQAGYFYADGTLQRIGRGGAAAMAAAGFAGMVGLISFFGYPVSMVEVPGQETSNTAPPSIGLIFLGLWLIGLAMAFREPAGRWLRDERRWRVVTGLNRVALTAYLWHVTAITTAVAVLYPLGLPQPEIGTGQWWALRPLFVASMLPVLVLLIVVFGRFEVHPDTAPVSGRWHPVRIAAVAFGVFSLAICLLGFGITGFIQLADQRGVALLVFRFNPLQNVAHGLIGAAAVVAALRHQRWAAPAALAGAALFLAGGWAEMGDAMTVLGMNDVTAVAHLVVGGSALTAIVLSIVVTKDPVFREHDTAQARHNDSNQRRGG